jgi:hypothetical protein
MEKFHQNPDLYRKVQSAKMLIQQPVEFPTAVTHKSLTVWSHLWTIRKLRELPTETVFGTSGVSMNPRLEIEDPFCRCSIQKQNSAATLIIKIL